MKPKETFSNESFPNLNSAPYEEAGRLFACGQDTDGKRLLKQALSDLGEAIDYLEPGAGLGMIAIIGVSAFMVLGQLHLDMDEGELILRSGLVEDHLKN